MRNLIALPEDPSYLDRYVAIRDRKKDVTRTPLIAAQTLIEKRYKAFAEAIKGGSLASLQCNDTDVQLSDALRACYDVPTKPLKQLKEAIRDVQPKSLLKYCPMCGTTLPRTFDHYIPAVRFPEFAVHPLNLIPCCSTCNSTKGDDWLCAAGKRQFLHGYTDEVPDLQFVQVRLHENQVLSGVGATFFLLKPADVADELWQIIASHFSRLKLINRYDELGNDEISEILSCCRVFHDEGWPNVRRFLDKCAEDRRRIYGRNHWVSVLMAAMAEHPNLETWIRVT